MKKLSRGSLSERIVVGVTMALGFVFIQPLILVAINAFKNSRELVKPLYALPEGLYLGNFQEALSVNRIDQAFYNSVLVAVLSVTGIVLLASMSSYALARWENKATRLIYLSLIMGMVIPFFVTMIPMFKLVYLLRMTGRLGLTILYWAMGMSLATFLMTGFVKSSVPLELEESMMIDGSSTLRTFFTLVLPLMRPIIITVVMLDTIWVWNDYLLPSVILTGDAQKTLPPIQAAMCTQYFQKWNLLFATFTVSMAPIVLLFFSCQRYVIRGITEGSLKG